MRLLGQKGSRIFGFLLLFTMGKSASRPVTLILEEILQSVKNIEKKVRVPCTFVEKGNWREVAEYPDFWIDRRKDEDDPEEWDNGKPYQLRQSGWNKVTYGLNDFKNHYESDRASRNLIRSQNNGNSVPLSDSVWDQVTGDLNDFKNPYESDRASRNNPQSTGHFSTVKKDQKPIGDTIDSDSPGSTDSKKTNDDKHGTRIVNTNVNYNLLKNTDVDAKQNEESPEKKIFDFLDLNLRRSFRNPRGSPYQKGNTNVNNNANYNNGLWGGKNRQFSLSSIRRWGAGGIGDPNRNFNTNYNTNKV